MQINDIAQFRSLRDGPVPESATWTKILPGDGDLPLADLMRGLPAGLPVALEVPRSLVHTADPERFARRAFEATENGSGGGMSGS